MKKTYIRIDERGPIAAKIYTISSADVPDLEKCWSACNGIDGFGHEDSQLDAVRKVHGEWVVKLPGKPRLILFRRQKKSALEAKLWTTRSFGGDDDPYLIMASVAKAMIGLPANWLQIELTDWAPEKACDDDFDGRFELNIEVCANYFEFEQMKKIHKQFHKVFDHGTWG